MDKQLEELLATLQAQLAVHHMALRALARSHPDPGSVLSTWRGIRADAVAAAYTVPPDLRHSDWLAERTQAFAEDWTAELVDASLPLARSGTPPGA